MLNNDILNYLSNQNSNLKEITIENNILDYQGRKIDLNNFLINDLLQNNNSFKENINYMSSEDFFNIIEVNTKEIKKDENNIDINDLANLALNKLSDKKDNSIISAKTYFNILSNNQIDDEKANQIKDFETLMYQCMKYKDYLMFNKRKLLHSYLINIENLANIQETEKVNTSQRVAVRRYNEMSNIINDEKNIVIRKKVPNINVSNGYANAFTVLLSTIATGLIVAIALYLTI